MEDSMFENIYELARTRAKTLQNFKPKEIDKLTTTRVKRDLQVIEMAQKRAKSDSRLDFNKVVEEIDNEVFLIEALIFKDEIRVDPRVEAMDRIVVKEDEEGLVCGVCQEEFEVGEEASFPKCMHKFHGFCLWKWLDDRKTCPFCRFRILKN